LRLIDDKTNDLLAAHAKDERRLALKLSQYMKRILGLTA